MYSKPWRFTTSERLAKSESTPLTPMDQSGSLSFPALRIVHNPLHLAEDAGIGERAVGQKIKRKKSPCESTHSKKSPRHES